MSRKPLLLAGLVLGASLAMSGDAAASAAYGPCAPTSVQVIFNGAQVYVTCRNTMYYYDSAGALRSATSIAINLAQTTASAFNAYLATATAALVSGRSLYIWPNYSVPATSTLVYFQDLSIQ